MTRWSLKINTWKNSLVQKQGKKWDMKRLLFKLSVWSSRLWQLDCDGQKCLGDKNLWLVFLVFLYLLKSIYSYDRLYRLLPLYTWDFWINLNIFLSGNTTAHNTEVVDFWRSSCILLLYIYYLSVFSFTLPMFLTYLLPFCG